MKSRSQYRVLGAREFGGWMWEGRMMRNRAKQVMPSSTAGSTAYGFDRVSRVKRRTRRLSRSVRPNRGDSIDAPGSKLCRLNQP